MMNIRKATIKDFEQVDEIYKEVSALHYKMQPNRIKGPEFFGRLKNEYEESINEKESEVLIAVEDNHVIGFADIHIVRDPGNFQIHGKEVVKVEEIGVREGYQKKGVGRLLLQEVENWTKEHGIKQVELSARYANKEALAFYDKVGFDIVSVNLRKEI